MIRLATVWMCAVQELLDLPFYNIALCSVKKFSKLMYNFYKHIYIRKFSI